MKRLLSIILLGIAAILTVATLVPWTVSSRVLRDEISAQLSDITGVSVRADGDAAFALLPYPRVKLESVRIGQDGRGAMLDVALARGSVRVLPLLAGRLEMQDLSLVEPVLKLEGDWPSDQPPAQQLGRAVDILFGAPLARGRIRHLAVSAGRVETMVQDKPIALLTDINGALRITAGSAAELVGRFRWRGVEAEFSAWGIDAAEFARSHQSPIQLSLTSPFLKSTFSGTASGPDLQFNGEFSGETPDLVALGGWLSFEPPLSTTDSVAVSGQARLGSDTLSISSAKIRIGGQDFDGALLGKAEPDGLSVSGTLAAATLDASDLAISLIPGTAADGGWSRDPFPLWRLPRAKFDLRMSVGSLSLGPVTMENAALAVLSRGSRTDVVLAGADFQGGTLKGRFGVNVQPKGSVDMRFQVGAEKIAMGPGLAFLLDGRRLSGTGTGVVQLEGTGDSMATLMRSLEGRGNVVVKQGEIVGINLPDVLRKVERRPLGATLDLGGGRTPFESATCGFRVSQGVADVSDCVAQSAATRLAVTGKVGVGERTLALTGLATAPNSTPGKEPATLPFEITGTFDQPQFTPDARDLIRRSGAAAPFLQSPGAPRPTNGFDALAPVGDVP
jgi:AsmA protein